MIKVFILVVGFTGLSALSYSQVNNADTIFLKEVLVDGLSNSQFQAEDPSLVVSDSAFSGSLAETILQKLPIYFVQYGGKGQLSAINLRGLGSARTNLVWNGMELNSFTLGSSDYNMLTGLSGTVSLQKGNSSALYGNGAIGGAVTIDTDLLLKPGHTVLYSQGMGSFGDVSSKARYSYANKVFETYSSFYYQSIDNDYTYTFNDKELRQNNAAFFTRNVMHHSGVWLTPDDNLSIDLWYVYNYRQLQPIKGDLTSEDHLLDSHFRSVISWRRDKSGTESESKIGFTRDFQRYNNFSELVVDRTFLSHQSGEQLGEKLYYKIGFSSNFLNAKSPNYDKPEMELRTDLFLSLRWLLSDKLTLTSNLREPVVNAKLQPFSPAVGLAWQLANNDKLEWSSDWQVSRSYRLPTLNDRYWEPGGNPELKPELSKNFETGTKATYRITGKWKLSSSFRYFYHDVNDWIIWRPGGSELNDEGVQLSFWYPDNVRRVVATGLEGGMSVSYMPEDKSSHFIFSNQLSYTDARNKEALNRFDRSEDKQLPYTPRFVLLNNIEWHKNQWVVSLVNRYTGERFTETNNELTPIDGFFLSDIRLSRHWQKSVYSYSLTLSINNITDSDYENFRNTAMPGRSVELQFNLLYNFDK